MTDATPSGAANDGTGGDLPERVAASWERSAAAGVRPELDEPVITLASESLEELRRDHPLAQVFPVLDDVLGQAARDSDAVMAISDAEAQLLWVCGSPGTLRRAETIGFVEGSNWDERLMGTNAPGLSLTLDAATSVIAAEHFRQPVKRWSCAAAPIHDPVSGHILGVLDLTGGDEVVVPQTMALVRAAVRLAEAELALHQRAGSQHIGDEASGPQARLQVLGRDEAVLGLRDTAGRTSSYRLSRRHSEILLLLASAARGLSGDELAVLLYEHDSSGSTMRAEMNRLRGLLGDVIASRPYRLTCEIRGDWIGVDAQLAAGDLAGALRSFRGPVLPRSTAPGVVRLREASLAALREAVLCCGDPGLMSTWTRTSWGADDYTVWQAQRDAVGEGSALFPLIAGQIARLDRDLR